jgi:hypothetical protein
MRAGHLPTVTSPSRTASGSPAGRRPKARTTGLRHGRVRYSNFRAKGRAEGRLAKAPDSTVWRFLCRLEDGEVTAAQPASEAISIRGRDRARCLRAELARLLRQAEDGRTCLLANANAIWGLAEELVEVEDKLAEELAAA